MSKDGAKSINVAVCYIAINENINCAKPKRHTRPIITI